MPKRSNKRPLFYSDRIVGIKSPRERFLIVCEGERTEPNYFRSFRVAGSVAEVDIRGLGYNTVSLVKETIKIKSDDEYDQIWCVFDRDEFPAEKFNEALSLAKRHNLRVAYSNEAFEIWYLLHFHFYQTAMTRKEYINKLSNLLGYKYEKNSDTVYEDLEDKQATGLKNAKRLLEQYEPAHPERDNPSTTVHLLVEELNRFRQ